MVDTESIKTETCGDTLDSLGLYDEIDAAEIENMTAEEIAESYGGYMDAALSARESYSWQGHYEWEYRSILKEIKRTWATHRTDKDYFAMLVDRAHRARFWAQYHKREADRSRKFYLAVVADVLSAVHNKERKAI